MPLDRRCIQPPISRSQAGRGLTFMAPQQRAFAFFCLPIFRRRLTIWPVASPCSRRTVVL